MPPRPHAWAAASANARIFDEMSVATTRPVAPTSRAAVIAGSPAPAATSSTRLPVPMRARSSITSVAGPSHVRIVDSQRFQASAALCHCCRVVSLNATASSAAIGCASSSGLCAGDANDGALAKRWRERGMSQLRVAVLGGPRVWHGDSVLTFPTRKALALFVYLVVEGGRHSREKLAALFWPDSDQSHARAMLRYTLAGIRRTLRDSANAPHVI